MQHGKVITDRQQFSHPLPLSWRAGTNPTNTPCILSYLGSIYFISSIDPAVLCLYNSEACCRLCYRISSPFEHTTRANFNKSRSPDTSHPQNKLHNVSGSAFTLIIV